MSRLIGFDVVVNGAKCLQAGCLVAGAPQTFKKVTRECQRCHDLFCQACAVIHRHPAPPAVELETLRARVKETAEAHEMAEKALEAAQQAKLVALVQELSETERDQLCSMLRDE